MREVLSRLASLELVSRLSPSFWQKTTGPTVLSHDTKPCRRTSAWEAIRTDTVGKSILLRPWPRLFKVAEHSFAGGQR